MEKCIKKDSPLPLYYQLKQILIEMIENNELTENAKIPTEKALCQKYNISRVTVRQALNELENEDYIYKIQGKGTFVSPEKFKQELLNFYSFTDEMKKLGNKPGTQVLDFKVENAEKKVAEVMDISSNKKVYKFSRLRLADNIPMMLETTYLPYQYFPGIEKDKLEKRPLYDILMGEYDLQFSRAEESFRATLLTEEEASKLNYINGGPAILLERTTLDKNNRIVEYTKSIARGDKFKYHVVLEK